MTEDLKQQGPPRLYASQCCYAAITYEGEPEWPGSEVATMNAKCTACGQWCTPIDVAKSLSQQSATPQGISEEEIERIADDHWNAEAIRKLNITGSGGIYTATMDFDKESFKKGLRYALSRSPSSGEARIAELEGALREIRKINVSLLSGGPSDTAALNCRNICDRALSPPK